MLWFYILYSEYVKNRRRFDPLFFLDAKLKNVAVKKCITDKYLNLSRNLSRIVISSEFIKRKKQNWLGSTQLHFDAISRSPCRRQENDILHAYYLSPKHLYIYILRVISKFHRRNVGSVMKCGQYWISRTHDDETDVNQELISRIGGSADLISVLEV